MDQRRHASRLGHRRTLVHLTGDGVDGHLDGDNADCCA